MKLPEYADPAALARLEKLRAEQLADQEYVEKASCCICFSNLSDAVVMNCGHGGICYECGKSILLSSYVACHLCREPLVFVLQMDLSNTYQNFINVKSATYVDDSSDSDDEEGQSQEQSNNENGDEGTENNSNLDPNAREGSRIEQSDD